MKKINIILSFLTVMFSVHSCQSQISISKEFDKNEYICSYHNFEDVNLYATFDTDNNEIKIYNSKHQLQSSLIFNIGKLYNSFQIYGLSIDVFNSDSNIEFLIHRIGADGTQETTVLINDQNQIIQEFGSYVGLRTIGNKNYIVESKSETIYDHTLNQAELMKTDKIYEITGKFRRLIY